jgi:glycosyltransferase involved in cell wall biosynthesis
MRIAYLISQYPAINHGYLQREIQLLRELGVEIQTASVSSPDRPADRLSADEREAVAQTFYIKQQPLPWILVAILATLITRPWRFLRGLRLAWAMTGARGLLYFVEAVVLGRWMRGSRLTHVHASFAGHVAQIACEIFPLQASLAVYGYGELSGSQARFARLCGSMRFVRCISRHSRSTVMLACPPDFWDRIVCAPLGVDVAAFSPAPFREHPDPFTLTYVGRLAPEKGQAMLLRAVAQLHREGVAVRLCLVGDGPDRTALEQQAARLSLNDAVIFEGHVDEERLAACYGESDAFVLTSLFEGIPIVLMEAMAQQIPCIAPRITGIPELIADGVSGLLFHPADDDDLLRALRRVIEDPALRRSLAQAGRRAVEAGYDMRRNTAEFAKILRARVAHGYP